MIEFLGYVVGYFIMVGLTSVVASRYFAKKGREADLEIGQKNALALQQGNPTQPTNVKAESVGGFVGLVAGVLWPATIGLFIASLVWKLVRIFIPKG